jgi:uncharacterized lipoprotein
MTVKRSLIAVSALAALAGCTTYYEVKDPTTGNLYYTTDLDKGREGAVTLVDEGSEAEVTIQNSEIREISKDEFKANAYKVDEPAPAAEPEAAAEPAAGAADTAE